MKFKRLLATILTVAMLMTLLPTTMFVSAAVPSSQKPANPTSNLVIGILNDSSIMPDEAFPNEPGITGLDYYYVEFRTGNDGNVNFSLSESYNGHNFSESAGDYINTTLFWSDDRIIMNNAGNAFGYYSPTGLTLDDLFFEQGFDEFFQEESIITEWMRSEYIFDNASNYKLLFYVIKYEDSPWGSDFSGYHLDAKVVKTGNVVLSYDANKPDGVTADIILPNSHSVTPGTNITVEDLNNRYKNQTANGLNYSFTGWNTQKDGSGTAYAAGNTVAVTEDTILYAQWDITNKYEVTWVNYNDRELYSTGHTVSYGDSLPAYSGPTPTRPDDGAHTYTFSHWDLIEGAYDEEKGVTQDLVYKAVYTNKVITHKATVAVVLNGTFDQDGNPSNANPGIQTDIDVVDDVDENALYIKAVNGNDYIKLERDSEGIYSNAAVGNGNYLIYRKDNGEYIQVGTQELSINNADRTRYLPYYSVTYNDGFGGEFRKEYYYIGSEVDVIAEVPQQDEYVFKNWEDGDGTPYNPSTALLTVDITDSIIKAYELTAQWEAAAKVSVTVVANHNGRSEDPTNDLTLHLTQKDAADNYNQVAGTPINVPASEWFDGELTSTTYNAGIVYRNLDPAAEYAAHAAIPGYKSDTDRNGGAIEVNYDAVDAIYAVTIYLVYDPDGYELEFAVEVDQNIEERFVPQAVDVKVTRWNETDSRWEVIPQHEHQSVEVAIDPTTRRGTGKVHVWGFNGTTPYLYRIEVIRVDLGTYQIDMGTSADLINYASKEDGFFPEGAYTAEVIVESHLEGNGLPGAHADKSGETLMHHGSIVAEVTAHPYSISLDPNGGQWSESDSGTKIIEDRRFTVPDLAAYKPTREGYTFAGWVKKGTSTGVKASDAIMAYNIEVGGTLELAAVWNENITVTGTVVVDLGYYCDDDSRQVMVLLQRREGDGTYYVTADDQVVLLGNPNGTYVTGSYSFLDVPNLDTYHYRINVVVEGGGAILYQNEPESLDPANLMDESKYNENDFVVELNGDLEAVVNVYMEAIPFELGYMADTSAIAADFRPTDLTLDLWHDHQVGEEEEYHQIIPLLEFVGTFTDGVSAIETVLVPPYHANGRLYDYTISVLSYDLDENVMAADANGWNDRHYYHYDTTVGYFPAPFSIRYTGPAEYNETGIEVDGTTYKQDVILKAIFEPNTYAINYELNGGHWESGNVGPTHHKWSFETDIPTPVRDGYLFNGWTVTTEDDDQTDIYDAIRGKILGKAWTNVTFTANWKLDEWTDGNPDAQDLGDGTPDEQQVRIVYVSANPAFGTIKDNKELDIVTLPATVTAEAEANPVDANHEFVKWTCEDVTITNPENAALSQEIEGAVGGKTYVFVAEFKAVDDWHDAEDKDDMPDSIPDINQVRIVYRSGNIIFGNVSRGMDIITLEPAPATSGNITVENVTATANNGYKFTGWHCEKITFTDTTPILNHSFTATGGESYEFVADFAPVDDWNAENDSDTPDGTPDMYQVKIHFESADITMGEVAPTVDIITIPGAVPHGTVKAEAGANANSGYRFVKWTHEGNQIGTAAALDYDFAATGGSEYTFVANFEASGGGGGGGGITRYTLTYETNGGNEIAKESYNSGKVVELTKVPKKEGYIFDGWHLDSELNQDASEVKMTKHITVYAAWIEDNGSAGSGHDTPGSLNGEDHFAYVVGYPDGTVRPKDNISRAEVTSIFFRLLKPDEVRDKNLTSENGFADVNTTDWYNTAISTMAKLGIVNGRTFDSFVPNAFITRAEFAAICARFDDSEFEIIDEFTDVAGHWAEAEIHEAAAHGWIRGYEDNTFKPDQFITRAEAMTMINRVLNRVPETKDDLLDDMIKWPDNSDESVWYYLPVQEATNSHEYDMKNHIYEKWSALREATNWTKYE